MSSVLRQLMVFHTDLHRFVDVLKDRLGPQLRNVPLLYQGTPELKDVLDLFDIEVNAQQEPLTTNELRARFQSLVENVFSVIAETRLFALFLDDLHEADVSWVHLFFFIGEYQDLLKLNFHICAELLTWFGRW